MILGEQGARAEVPRREQRRRRGLLAAGALLLALTALAPLEAAAGPASRANVVAAPIVFVRDGDIYRMSATGTNVVQLTKGPFVDRNPARRGGKVAFERYDPAGFFGWHIWVMNSDGSGATRITSGSFNHTEPAWSPDGSRIVYVSDRPLPGAAKGGVEPQRGPDLWVMNADGSGRTPLTRSVGVIEYTPAWSPDGTKIAYVSGGAGTGGGDLFVLTLMTGTVKQLTTGPPRQLETSPTWSPDGARIAYARRQEPQLGSDRIYVIRSGGSPPEQLTNHTSSFPSWSPDGSAIAYVATRRGGGIEVMDVDGSDPRPVGKRGVGAHPNWGGY
jgi:Tol biopolymer transport system component